MKEFYQKNRENYLNKIEDTSLSVFYSGEEVVQSGDQAYPFQINNNFYYLTGLQRPTMILLMGKGAGNTREYLFIEEPSEYAALWIGAKMTKEEASEVSGISVSNIFYIQDFLPYLNRFLQMSRQAIFGFVDKIYLDLERDSFESMPSLGNKLAIDIQAKYPNISIFNAYNELCVLRTYKTETEINEIKKAIKITKEGLENMMSHSKTGMKECQIESYFDQTVKFNDSTFAFKTIAASGVNATVLHYHENNQVSPDNSLILFDLGATSNHYCADITRTFPVNGKFTDRQKEIYSIVLECNKKCIEWLKPGVTNREYNDFARQILIDGCKRIGLIKEDAEISKYYYHSIGHFLGLDTHDVGEYITPFKEGCVLTVEPGLYIREEGIGIRIEDDVVITKDGCELLSKDVIKEIDDVEEFFSKYNVA